MDNNNAPRKRKRVTKEMLRRRQMTALAVIFFIIVMIILGIASCTKKSDDSDSDTQPQVSTAVTPDPEAETEAVTEEATTEAPTEATTAVPTADPNDPNTITNLEVDRHEVFLETGESEMPLVTMTPYESMEKGEIWTSSDESIAIVGPDGNITGVGPGTCYVKVQSENNPSIEASIRVTVVDDGYAYTSDNSTESDVTPLGTSEETKEDRQSQLAADAPAPPVYDSEGLTYVKGQLFVNKYVGLPKDFAPELEPICEECFVRMANNAWEEGLTLFIGSSFRSYSDQVEVFASYMKADDGEKVSNYSARPGFSEHQTGLAIDCNTIDSDFGYTAEGRWLEEHAHEYGFIIRYPKGKEDITGYEYEPWHIRYVGYEAAKYMYDHDQCLEEYLGMV